ncbi:hypothetical protein [Bacillus mesophilum]|uniref:Uncharacterized protein n=1 Tax=Bacillus mesophilum TaxID=1071718 RepID=A0A7V7RLE1_9BACI|nr:hypothetical protein [Bacillus mesophilum]KAB2332614.1 hypothetical protein F7732_11010 [Bacillus mesophilum]
MNEMKVLNRDPGKLLSLLADDVQELMALIAELQLLPLDSDEFKQAQLLSGRLNMARQIQDKTIFSVTGLQGAGKTTFVKRLYNLHDDTLPIDAGRSEVLPILLTESEAVDPGEFIFKVRRSHIVQGEEQCKFEITDEIIQHDQFLEIARRPDVNDLWLEIEVPVTHFGTGISLALLPGFERDKRERSQRDLDFMLSLSTSVIFVMNYRMLAREDQRVKIQDMINRYKNHAPLFAISFSDELDTEKREYYAQLLSEHFDISEEERTRITFTGKSEDLSNWEDHIVSSINRYGKLTTYTYKKQMELMRELSTKSIQLADAVNERIRMRRLEGEESETNILQNSEVLNSFRKYKKEFMDEFEKSLQSELQQHAKDCSDKMDKYLVAGNTGIANSFKQFFKGDQVTLKEKVVFREKTMSIWNGEDNQASEEVIMSVLNRIFDEKANELGFNKPELIEQTEEPVEDNPFAISVSSSTNSSVAFQPGLIDGPAALERVTHYLQPASSDTPVVLEDEDLKLLPFLAVGFTQSLLAATPVLQPLSEIDLQSRDKNVQSLTNHIQKLQFEASSLVKGTALFMGIDALDGTFDTFGALTGLLTKFGVSASAATPVAGLLIGGIAGGLAVHSGLQKIEQQRLNQSTYASMAFNMTALQQKESILATMNKVLGKMEARLQSVHKYRDHGGASYGKLDTAKYKLSRIKELSGTMQGMTYRNELYLG